MALVIQVPREPLLYCGIPRHGVSGMPLGIHDVTCALATIGRLRPTSVKCTGISASQVALLPRRRQLPRHLIRHTPSGTQPSASM
jgi:hypothetical protein